MTSPLAIKGVHNGLLVSVPEGDTPEALSRLLETIDEQADFFRGARLSVQLGSHSIRAAEMGRLRDALAEREVSLVAVLTESDVTRGAAADLGLSLELIRPRSETDLDELPLDTELTGDEAVLVQQTLRSGYSIRHPGHVVVLGDVNPGAEIIAGGHVIVWGRLRGVVHAGAAGDERAMVCALDLAPTQLRIAGHIATSPERRGQPKPEMALVREGQLVAEHWHAARRR